MVLTREQALKVLNRYVQKDSTVRTAAFEEQPEGGVPGSRQIPKNHDYSPKALKPMAETLWAASVGLGHVLTAYRHFSRLKSATISPDGMLGGRGYVLGIQDVRQKLFDACECLSAVTDTLYDEINGPHWKPKLALLDKNDAEDVSRFVDESRDMMDNPEEQAEAEISEIEAENDDEEKDEADEDETASDIPDGGSAEAEVKPVIRTKEANSSLPVQSLPGPRVNHLGPGEGTGPYNSYNPQDDALDQSFNYTDYDYTSEWDNDTSAKMAESAVPDTVSEPTETEAWDFGLGFGARGQGAGGYANPTSEGRGVLGPASGLPNSPSLPVGDTTPGIERELNETRNHYSYDRSELPNDSEESVARSDYYLGEKSNLVNSESELPNEVTPNTDEGVSMLDTDYKHEDLETPYVRYDYTTHDYREDPLHNWPEK